MEENLNIQSSEEVMEVLPETEVVEEVTPEIIEAEPETIMEEESSLSGILLAGASIVGIGAAAFGLFKKCKAAKVKKELAAVREDVVKKLTDSGEIEKYTEAEVEEIAQFNYFKIKNNIK